MRLARESAIHDHVEENADLDSLLTDVDDDKTFAAMGVAKTISTVIYFLSPRFILNAKLKFVNLSRSSLPSIALRRFCHKFKRLSFPSLYLHWRTGCSVSFHFVISIVDTDLTLSR
jgi:hypothetical protein